MNHDDVSGEGCCNHENCKKTRALARVIRNHCEPLGIGPLEACKMMESIIRFLQLDAVIKLAGGDSNEVLARLSRGHGDESQTTRGVLESPGRPSEDVERILREVEKASEAQESDEEQRIKRAMRLKPGNA